MCLLTLDLDRFKAVNDTLGHTVGDTLLRQVAARLSACVREEDLVSHPGGDEFAAVCTRAVTDHAIGVVAQRLVDAVVEPFDVAGREVFLTASVGVAVSDRGDETAEALLRDADAAMYRAKELGGGRYETFDLSLRHRLVERMTIEADLRHAIERDQLELYYQPIIDLADERPIGFEALLRWHHPDRGLVGPSEFIHIAEETGMIVPIGDWVLRSVAEQLSRWPDTIHVSANVSALQIGLELVADVEALLVDHRLAPSRLVLEITESLVLDPRVRPVVAGLRALGVQLALDDFGTGYSSLGSIQRFPLDLVKLDRALVSSLPGGRSVAVVRAAVELGHALGVAVIAEGIEDRVQLESLRELGCRLGQGFLFAQADAGAGRGAAATRLRSPRSPARMSRPPRLWLGRREGPGRRGHEASGNRVSDPAEWKEAGHAEARLEFEIDAGCARIGLHVPGDVELLLRWMVGDLCQPHRSRSLHDHRQDEVEILDDRSSRQVQLRSRPARLTARFSLEHVNFSDDLRIPIRIPLDRLQQCKALIGCCRHELRCGAAKIFRHRQRGYTNSENCQPPGRRSRCLT